ncbi:nuclease-related domain-containing protein [Asanoa sp. NPDC049573]|uniref:nuclease-related domain-containing protein n=1 Tax=Asanoa sp. NPDC049573 TaxID=3155396 RepID=UPI00341E7563
MRVEMLSDHGGALLRGSRDRLRGAVAIAQLEYRQAWAHVRAVHRARSLWRRVRGAAPAAEQQPGSPGGTWQEVLLAREDRVATCWGGDPLTAALGVLPDDWVMLRGYRNRRGETDHVLVGPQGIWAVAVKRRRIRLHAVGDRWWWEKLDARGRSIETGWAVEGGRSWARQVNDIADDLAAWLRRNRHDVPVRTAVVLLHEQAQLGRCQDPTVSLVGTGPTQLLEALARYAAPLAAPEIADLVRRDHAFHQRRRDRRL